MSAGAGFPLENGLDWIYKSLSGCHAAKVQAVAQIAVRTTQFLIGTVVQSDPADQALRGGAGIFETVMKKYLGLVYRRIFARPAFEKLNSRLFYLGLHGLGVLNFENDEISGEKYLLHDWLPTSIKKKAPIFFDVGANVGNFTKLILECFPSGFVHAFEPHPKNYLHLNSNAFPPDRAKCHNIAIGQSQGSLTLYDRADHEGSPHASLHEESISEFHHQASVATAVPVETLDSITSKENVEYIDYLKIDTEGHELAVLAGASRLLREGRIGHIHFEFNALNIYSRSFFRDFRNTLYNYDLYRLLPRGLLPLSDNVVTTEIFAYQNILALPKQSPSVPRVAT